MSSSGIPPWPPSAPNYSVPISAIPVIESRPGILTAVGVFSIIVASIALLVNMFGLLVVANIPKMAVRQAAITHPPALVVSPPVAAPPAEYVAPDGLSASERQIVIHALSQMRSLSDARQRQLDGLLADAGRRVIHLSTENITNERVTAYVSDARDFPGGSDTQPDDLFILGSGRLQLSDQSAVFFPANSPSGIRSQGGSFTDSEGTHLASNQIAAVERQVQTLCNQAMNDAQRSALELELKMTSETLIDPSPSVAQAAGQVQSAQVLSDGTVAVTTNRGSMSFSPTGTTWPGVIPMSGMTPAWVQPQAPRLATTILTLETLLSLLAGSILLTAGILVMKNSRHARRVHIAYAIGKIILASVACWALYSVALTLAGTAPDAKSTASMWVIFCAAPGFIYPVILLIVMSLPNVREFFAVPTLPRS